MIAQGWASFSQIALGLFLFYGLVPLLLLPRRPGQGPLARWLAAITFGVTFWLATGYLLSLASSVELATVGLLLVAAALGSAYFLRRRGQLTAQAGLRDERVARLLDALDPSSPHSLISLAQGALGELRRRLRASTRATPRAYALVALGAAAWILWRNLQPALVQVSPATPDGYQQLLAAKTIALNLGTYAPGVYPLGVPLVVAVVSTAMFYDAMNVLRFLGPLTAVLAPVAAAALAGSISDSGWAASTALLVTGLTALPDLTTATSGTWSPLGLHAAVLFLLLATYFSVRFLRRSDPFDAVSAAAGSFVAVMMQPLSAPLALLLPALLALPFALSRRPVWRLPAWTSGGVLAGLLPLVAGWLGHHAWSTLAVPTSLPTPPPPPWLAGANGSALLAAAALAVAASAWMARRKGADAPLTAGLALVLGALAALSVASLPSLWSLAWSQGHFAGMLGLPLATGWLFSLLGDSDRYPRAPATVAVALGAGALLAAFAPVQPSSRYAAVGSGRAVEMIAAEFPAYQWTVVSPVQEYSEVLGHGWHVELIDLLRKVPIGVAGQARFRLRDWKPLRIETSDTFLFVPLRTPGGLPTRPGDRGAPLPDANGASVYVGRSGEIVDAHAMAWALAFQKAHPRAARVFLRTPGLLVLWIRQ